ncbi:MAG: LysM-repeat protein and domain [Segetibacter sp.]|nr:LysM-repeat protein and domain [Segetibacter sp.]
MSNFYRFLLLVVVIAGLTFQSSGQYFDTSKPVKVAVFIPLYADDVFNGASYILDKANLPKNVLPGLEFYNGVMMAIDSLNEEGARVEISIYDTKQTTQSLSVLLRSSELNNVGLIIAGITNTSELKLFSDQALRRNIPLISATYPNYVGVSQNPYFVVLNSSFQAHLQGVFKHMQRYYGSQNIVAVTRKGPTEDFVKNYFTTLNKSPRSTPLKLKWLTIDDAFSNIALLQKSLDSTKNNVVFVGSPLETFGLNVVQSLSSNESYRATAIGMPTWDNIKDLDKPKCKNVEIVFSTPFLYYSQNPGLSSLLNKRYKEKYYSRPSDMVFKGFEMTYHFTKLLDKHKNNLVNNLSDKSYTLFNQFLLQPIRLKTANPKPDFLENRKLYFIKKQAGIVKSII